MKFIIDRNKWLRGEGSTASCLLRPEDGKMCCLGLFLKSLGSSDESLKDLSTPADIDPTNSVVPEWLVCHSPYRPNGIGCPADVSSIMDANDNMDLSEDYREHLVEKFFASKGIEVVFQDNE